MQTDVIVIGSGVIGLSVSYYLAKGGYKVVLVEKEKSFGLHTSSRNTEVIHAGIYYQTNSLKHKLCIRGKNLLYTFLKYFSVNFNKCGKYFISNSDQELNNLIYLKKIGEQNGLNDLDIYDYDYVKKNEPLLKAKNILLSPSSGIFDSYEYLSKLETLSNDLDVIISYSSPFINADFIKNSFWKVNIGGINKCVINSKFVVNCAGLNSSEISSKVFNDNSTPLSKPVKGAYLRYLDKPPFKHIIYSALIPGKIQERADSTPDINGMIRFGPSIEKVNISDYSFPKNLIERFVPLIKVYFPQIEKDKLTFDQVGIRPKINSSKISDFHINNKEKSGWFDLLGIESPGLTASLAIGEYLTEEIKHL